MLYDCNCIIIILEAREVLKKEISSARETLSTAEKIAGKWNKDDKVCAYTFTPNALMCTCT